MEAPSMSSEYAPSSRFTFYATVDSDSIRPYMPDVPWMLPASSWARKNMKAPKLPAHITRVAADCGGYVATKIWGDYRYTPAAYTNWLATFGPEWAAMMDYCCEPDLPVVTRDRQARTTEMAHRFWSDYRGVPWCWVPTIQGWEVGDYRRHARELRPLILEMMAYYGAGSAFRVGIGTLCRRASKDMIRQVSYAVASELPGMPLHLWGIKLGALSDRVGLPYEVASTDSAAWNALYGRGRDDFHNSGLTQRRFTMTILLPAYIAKVEGAVSQIKQRTLDDLLS